MKPKLFGAVCSVCLLQTSMLFAGSSTEPDAFTSITPTSTSDPWITGSLNAGFETLHVYRGVDSSFGEQNYWGSLDLDMLNFFHFNLYSGHSSNREYNELTPSAYLYKDVGPVRLSTGVILYHFPSGKGSDSDEYFVSASSEIAYGIQATAYFSYNERADGWYDELKLSRNTELTDRLSLETSAALGFSDGLRSGGNGLDNLTISVGLPIKITDQITLKPLAGYAFALDALDSGDESWAGLTASFKF
ncbi:hypothetical protein JIN85_04355 [Luteolibacter pohnpeiensis]|uniref:Transporter n=1 Tax=Luteolibacter pohnpeiensis TaxID=454153 RepID=A0A934VQ18_9BACT|nr:hypothetical protein [Luteolibacter pohnpeiensis]MBK1881631.1 hypothetical protein [Luteolibacter pohnpeiensis]